MVSTLSSTNGNHVVPAGRREVPRFSYDGRRRPANEV
jgi:hypothetical protein